MLGLLASVVALAVSASHGLSSPLATEKSKHCSSVVFRLPAAADNFVFANPPDPNDGGAILKFVSSALSNGPAFSGTQRISDTYSMHAVYCRPTASHHKHVDVLQIFVHGITYNSTMWFGYGFDDSEYNWPALANAQGYHTLAIDRLGHGLNTKTLDPFNVVQTPLQVEVMHALIQTLRTNPSNVLGAKFSQIIYVGHSFGSQIGVAVGRLHPSDIDIAILTGYSSFFNNTVGLSIEYDPATVFNATRFPAKNTPLGYLTFASGAQREELMYNPHGGYDRAIARHDADYRDTLTAGELATASFLFEGGRGYRGKVLVVTGSADSLFCPATASVAACEEKLRQTKTDTLPDVEVFEIYSPEGAGHDVNLHYGAKKTFGKIDEFLSRHL